ncbi:MAG: hypothetical protein ACOH2V_13290 [Candidatus Saccharimonadaceae bacterium]
MGKVYNLNIDIICKINDNNYRIKYYDEENHAMVKLTLGILCFVSLINMAQSADDNKAGDVQLVSLARYNLTEKPTRDIHTSHKVHNDLKMDNNEVTSPIAYNKKIVEKQIALYTGLLKNVSNNDNPVDNMLKLKYENYIADFKRLQKDIGEVKDIESELYRIQQKNSSFSRYY